MIVSTTSLSLAIGRDGQNALLAAKLTGWKVDIKSETEFSQVEDEMEFERPRRPTAAAPRCFQRSAVPDAASGSRYCGLPQHQALARFDTNHVTVLAPPDEEVAGSPIPTRRTSGSALIERPSAGSPRRRRRPGRKRPRPRRTGPGEAAEGPRWRRPRMPPRPR